MKKVSIIMPIYNGERFLEKSIESVSKQTIDDIELICVDDGSIDGSLNLLNQLQEKYDFIKILTQENQGSGKARNYGIDKASGEYIGFLDADDIFVDEDALERMYELGHAHDADMVAGNLEELLPNGDLIYNSNYTDDNYYEFIEEEKICPKDYGVPWAFYKNIYKKSFLVEKDIRFRDLIRGQDPVFMAEVLVNLDEIYGVPVVLYAYLFPEKGNTYGKVNSPKKRLHYVTHYKRTFDIFEEGGLENLSEKYKPKFLNFFRYSAKVNDLDAYDTIMEVFGKKNHYFDNFKERYDFYNISLILNKINAVNTEEYFKEAKEEIKSTEVWKVPSITAYQHRLISFINSCDTFEEYKKGYPDIHITYLKNENKRLTRKHNSLLKQVKKNQRKNRSLKKLNKSLLNSSSWKMTSGLRKLNNRNK